MLGIKYEAKLVTSSFLIVSRDLSSRFQGLMKRDWTEDEAWGTAARGREGLSMGLAQALPRSRSFRFEPLHCLRAWYRLVFVNLAMHRRIFHTGEESGTSF